VESLLWYRKVYWLLEREFPYWLYTWDYVWTAGRIVLGKNYKTCLMSDLHALMVDRTEIYYNEDEFILFLQSYYYQVGETPFETINKLYKLRFLLSEIEECQDPAKVRKELVELIQITKHSTSKAFLLEMLADNNFQAGFMGKAVEFLQLIPHERRRSFAFLKKLYEDQYNQDLNTFYSLLENITNKADLEQALKIEYEVLLNNGQVEKSYESFVERLDILSDFDIFNILLKLFSKGEWEVLNKLLEVALEKLEGNVELHWPILNFLEELNNGLREQGIERYNVRINRIVRESKEKKAEKKGNNPFIFQVLSPGETME